MGVNVGFILYEVNYKTEYLYKTRTFDPDVQREPFTSKKNVIKWKVGTNVSFIRKYCIIYRYNVEKKSILLAELICNFLRRISQRNKYIR